MSIAPLQQNAETQQISKALPNTSKKSTDVSKQNTLSQQKDILFLSQSAKELLANKSDNKVQEEASESRAEKQSELGIEGVGK